MQTFDGHAFLPRKEKTARAFGPRRRIIAPTGELAGLPAREAPKL
jgi:hypothetical protein